MREKRIKLKSDLDRNVEFYHDQYTKLQNVSVLSRYFEFFMSSKNIRRETGVMVIEILRLPYSKYFRTFLR